VVLVRHGLISEQVRLYVEGRMIEQDLALLGTSDDALQEIDRIAEDSSKLYCA
jgi:hypothetical protein